jgi:uncharacterized protein (TIGR02231 family)
MRKTFLAVCVALLTALVLPAQTQVSTEIKEVTVYLRTAQITRVGRATLPAGRGAVVFSGLSAAMDPNSVRLGATGEFTILTVTPRNNFLAAATESAEFVRLSKERQTLADDLAKVKIRIDVLEEEEKLILANRSIGGSQSGVDVGALQEMAAYTRTRLQEIRATRLDLAAGIRDDQTRLQKLDQQLEQLRQTGQQSVAEVVVQYQSDKAVNAEFQLMYIVNGASWSATYDLRVSDLTRPVNVAYGALVSQNTGEDWKNVALTLSTGNPSQQQNAPVVRTWRLNPNQPMAARLDAYSLGDAEIMQSSNVVMSREEAAGATFAGADVAVNLTNTEFSVRLPQDIAADGQPYRVQVDDYELPTDYQYYAAPKYDCHVYLTARITDWQKYSFLPGPVNLFFDGAYVGKSQLSVATASDTLVFSLGRDEGLIIERKREEDYRSRKFLGNKTEQWVGWTITVAKNRRNDVPLIVEDQIPVSATEEIEVTLDQAKGAALDAATGKLRWELSMGMGEKREIGFRYRVKYPKGMSLLLE